jgi:ABC-type nickel/cobalt efflux system permease component RcnA
MDFAQLLQQGTAHAWLYIPVAILLGALHGLEPGHSKTMMAAFIIAVRGTVWQAALLGFCAALSHTLIIWILAGLALKYGSHWNVEQTEPYFLLVSGLIVIGMAVWTIMRLREEQRHYHHHHGEGEQGHDHHHNDIEDEDAHARAHAADIQKRFANRQVTTGQIVIFGLTGGLMPCPAAVSILIVCLQVKQFSLGFSIVAAFSFGLALTMISVGVLASWGFKKLAEKSGWFSRVAARAPYVSSYLLIALGLAFAWRGLAMMK